MGVGVVVVVVVVVVAVGVVVVIVVVVVVVEVEVEVEVDVVVGKRRPITSKMVQPRLITVLPILVHLNHLGGWGHLSVILPILKVDLDGQDGTTTGWFGRSVTEESSGWQAPAKHRANFFCSSRVLSTHQEGNIAPFLPIKCSWKFWKAHSACKPKACWKAWRTHSACSSKCGSLQA